MAEGSTRPLAKMFPTDGVHEGFRHVGGQFFVGGLKTEIESVTKNTHQIDA